MALDAGAETFLVCSIGGKKHVIPICALMDKFERQETHLDAEPCYLVEHNLVSDEKFGNYA